MDLTALRLEVTAVLGLTNTTTGDQPLVDTWINEGVTDVVMRTACRVQPATMPLTAGTVDYDLPSAILRIVDVYTAADSTGYTLCEVSPGELFNMRRLNSAASSAASRFYAVAGGNLLMIHPTPTAADTMHLLYVPRPVTLSAGADIPTEIPLEHHKLVTFYALSRAGDYDDDSTSQMGDRYRGMYEVGLAEMKKQLNKKGNYRLSPARIRKRGPVLSHDNSQYP